MKNKTSYRTGFTLVEILITSAIFAVIMVTVYSVFRTGTFGYKDIEENLQAQQSARQVLERIALDLRNSFNSSDNSTGFSGKYNEVSFFSLVDTFVDGKFLKKYALVSYKLQDDKLMRLCRTGKEALNDKSEVTFEEFAPGIKEVSFGYAGIQQEESGIAWKDSWLDNNTLPLAVRINLIFNDKSKQDFEKTVFLPLALYNNE